MEFPVRTHRPVRGRWCEGVVIGSIGMLGCSYSLSAPSSKSMADPAANTAGGGDDGGGGDGRAPVKPDPWDHDGTPTARGLHACPRRDYLASSMATWGKQTRACCPASYLCICS